VEEVTELVNREPPRNAKALMVVVWLKRMGEVGEYGEESAVGVELSRV